MRNCWVEGSGYLMKKECIEKLGLLENGRSFPSYCIQLAKKGYVNGWYYPFLYQNHFDDPRSEFSQLKSDSDMQHWAPLSALANGVVTIQQWSDQLKRSAALLQLAPYDVKYHTGWRAYVKRGKTRLNKLVGKKAAW